MSDNRRQVLELLAAGQITAEEAERLMAALDKDQSAPSSDGGSESSPRPKPKYLRVVVDAQDGHGYHGPTMVNIRVPVQLLRAGVKLASLIPAQARDHVNDAMREHGVQFDLSQIKPENLEELIDQLNDLTVDVDQEHGKVKVKVFCE
jgi:polyhydroxyalkanoate synthesis regulator phasin